MTDTTQPKMDVVHPKVTKVRAGFYRVGKLCLHHGADWSVYDGQKWLKTFRTLSVAIAWSMEREAAR